VELRQGVSILAAVALVSGSLGWMAGQSLSPDAAPGSTATTVGVPPEPDPDRTTTPAPTTTTTVPPEPLRVLLAGDSVMAGLAPAVEAALAADDDADVEFVLTPTLLRDDTVRFAWTNHLEGFAPNVVVMFVGTWEVGAVTQDDGRPVSPDDDTWRVAYERDILGPWVDLVTATGAEVVWIGAPPVPTPEVDVLFGALNRAYTSLAERRPDVEYLESSTALAAGGDGFVPVVTTAEGRSVRVRQIDGLHLCPDGAVLLARALLDELGERRELRLAAGWEAGAWRGAEEYPAGDCPDP
jgi:hypothetical protein